MIALPNALKAIGGAHSGIDPAHLLDVLDVNGNAYYWSDRPVNAPTVLSPYLIPSTPGYPLPVAAVLGPGQYVAWAFPTQAEGEGDFHTSIHGSNCSGSCDQFFDGPFTAKNRFRLFNFQPSTLPLGAIVDSCHLVSNYSCTNTASNDFGVTAPGAGIAITPTGLPGVASSYQAWLQNTVSSGEISIFFGIDRENFTIYSTGLCVIYHLPGSAAVVGGGGGSNPLNVTPGYGPYKPWILAVPKITFNRSLQTDIGQFILQNLSGDVLSRDFERIMRRSALEGAFFVYRLWDPSANAAWLEMHGTFSVDAFGVDTVTLKGSQLLNPAQDDTPNEIFCENCQNQWGRARCGATGTTECQYSFQTCQVVEHFRGFLNSYETNYGEAIANVATRPTNRRRKI
jgi:hypothetical protein